MERGSGAGTTIREERKVVTALFADIVGSTSLGERFDPEDVVDIVGRALARMVEVVEEFGGTVKDLAGDGILALFGAPEAHEDDAERAVRAGLRICDVIRDYAHDVARDWNVEAFGVRVGIETGLAVLGPVGGGSRVEYGATGDALNTASRLQSAAEPFTVLVGGPTHRLVRPIFLWSNPRRLALKGKAEPVIAYEVVGLASEPGTKIRGLEGVETPLVGRDAELASAADAGRALRAGSGGVLFVIGEPGIGKSRLVTELRDALTDDPTVQWLEGRCVSYGQALPYWPFRDLLRRWLHASVNDPEERLRTALRSRIGSLFERGAPEVAPLLAAILGLQLEPDAATALNALSPEALQFRTNEAMCSLVERVASTGPVVVAIDDLHWADSTSVQLLERLLALADSTPTLFVIAHRPERDHPSWRLHRTAGRARVLELDALHEGADRQLLEGLVGSGTLPADLERRILATAEGNPFYLEELVRSLVDAEALVSQAGRWKFDHSVDVEIPPTVEKVILARIDRLSSGARDAVQAASVLGRQFGLPLLRAVSDLDGRLSPALDELLRLDFLRREGSEPEPEYRFKHALIQEAAYQNMLKRRRRELHARAAQALKSLYEDRLEQPHGLLAHHYRGAGDLDRALRSFELAAGAARRVYAVEEALAHYSAALDIAISLASTRTGELYLQRGQVHAQAGDSSRARADLEAALAHARTSGDRRVEMHALSDIGFLLAGLASYGGALPHLGSALEVAEAAGDLAGQAGILSRLSIVYCNQLLFDRALEFAERARAVAERVGEDPVLATALDALKQVSLQIGDWETLGLIARDLGDILRRHDELWYLQFVLHESSFIGSASGEWEVSLERLQEALALNRRIGDRGNEPLHHAGLCMVNRMAGRYGPALEAGVRGCDLAAALDHAEWIGWAEATLGRLFIDLRAMDEAARHLERSAEASERAGAHTMTSRGLGHLAFVRLRQGRLDEAVPLMRRTEELLRGITTPPGWPYVFGTDVYVAVARVRLGLGEPEKAEAWVEPLRRTTERTRWVEASAFLPLVLGECMLARGDLSAAREHLEFAIEAASVGGLPAVEWEGHGVLAGVLRSDGRLEEAERHLETGLRIVQGLSATIPDTRARRRFVEGATAELRRRGGAT